jgi:hypothetical protein
VIVSGEEGRMYIPHLYPIALALLILTMLCWGCWVVFLRLCQNWRFELFYWDYLWGILLCSLLKIGRASCRERVSNNV